MSKKTQQPETDPYRKARFRELSRDIVFKDRNDRRSGYAVDTAGSIARALERAFREGFEAAQTDAPSPTVAPPAADEPYEWALIPPRPRDAFWTICLFCIGRKEHPKRGAKLIAALTERGTPGWLLTTTDNREIRTIGERTIVPLVRLGLLELGHDTPPSIVISNSGRKTWERFLARGGHYPNDLTAPDTIGRG